MKETLPNALAHPDQLKPFAGVQLIAFDLDGTLIDNTLPNPGVRLASLFSLASHFPYKIRITIATGRTLTGVYTVTGKLKELAETPLILYNGSVVIRPSDNAILSYDRIKTIDVEEILRLVNERQTVSAYVYCLMPEEAWKHLNPEIESVFYLGSNPIPNKDFNNMDVKDISELDLNASIVPAILLSTRGINDRDELISVLEKISGISVTSSSLSFLEIRPKGSSKAKAVDGLCKKLGIERNQVLAMGDNDNDVELLDWAGLGVSVYAATEAAREASAYVSEYGVGQAAIDVIELVRKARRLFKRGAK